ncbi:MAG: microtubule-binding protein MIP-T3-domain-containing protein [Olpidium bornovanus]|uniref:Microtubule-binding protein MIP-T3-domain-containing protein n=1 Tax=Olpidium bornovanus TaxID=278681 RepID=A0A8H7ZN66_9FUNG|nr:MAG: microtubule-binding protein MIP-T3-domain-containing protein [Olpidium bornovanus]
MLETKKELELDAASAAAPPVGAPVKEQVLARDPRFPFPFCDMKIEALRESIQHLCRSTHPLGTTLDYIQEDVDSMNTELEYWVKEYKQYRKRHEEALRATKEALAPLEAQLLHLEASIEDKVSPNGRHVTRVTAPSLTLTFFIREQQDAIAACKAKITENEIIINVSFPRFPPNFLLRRFSSCNPRRHPWNVQSDAPGKGSCSIC